MRRAGQETYGSAVGIRTSSALIPDATKAHVSARDNVPVPELAPTASNPTPARRAKTAAALGTLLATVGVLVALLVFLAGETLEAVGESDGIALWDGPALAWSVAHRTPTLTSALLAFTHSGGPTWQPIIALAVAAFLAWRWHTIRPLVLVVMAEAGAVAITVTAKTAVHRARPALEYAVPPYEYAPSFPSGHTLQAVVASTIVTYLLVLQVQRRWWRALVALLAALYSAAMAFSRVFLGYHWVTDVVAAVFLGLAWASVVIVCHRLWLRYGRLRPLIAPTS